MPSADGIPASFLARKRGLPGVVCLPLGCVSLVLVPRSRLLSPLSAAPLKVVAMSDATESTRAEQPQLLDVSPDDGDVVEDQIDTEKVTTTTEGPLDDATSEDDVDAAYENSAAVQNDDSSGEEEDVASEEGDVDVVGEDAGAGTTRPADADASDQEVLGASQPGEASTTVKDPSDWVTGDEPMTGAQKSYLDTLARAAGEQLPADLTKAEASEHIERLQAKTGRGSSS